MKKLFILCLVMSGLCVSNLAMAAQALEYIILKEGEPIGYENVFIDKSAETTSVEVETRTQVKLLFLEFNYDHKRKEIWKDGTLLSIRSKTDDDGTPHEFELNRIGNKLQGDIDGKNIEIEAGALPLSLWTKDVLNRNILLSVINAQPYKVTTTKLANDHYRIDGDISRELWFSDDGYLQKAAFERKGFLIEFLRK